MYMKTSLNYVIVLFHEASIICQQVVFSISKQWLLITNTCSNRFQCDTCTKHNFSETYLSQTKKRTNWLTVSYSGNFALLKTGFHHIKWLYIWRRLYRKYVLLFKSFMTSLYFLCIFQINTKRLYLDTYFITDKIRTNVSL